MYRQRKRDLNLKPNRQLDKRSSRGMIYENEELRMRTIAICEDVDRGQSDIKKLRKENDHLKREIWGLRDECEKLEEMLKKVCISANIPEIQLESSSKAGDDDDDDDYEDDDEDGSHVEDDVPPDKSSGKKYLKAGRQRRGSGTSVGTFDSDVGSYISSMFGDGDDQSQMQQEDIAFAEEDAGSVILNPEAEPVASTSAGMFQQHPSWSPHHGAVPPDLEAVREESESTLNSPATPLPPPSELGLSFDEEMLMLPDPSLVILPPPTSEMESLVQGADGRKTPVIQITPASSPNSNSNAGSKGSNSPETEDPPSVVNPLISDQEAVQNAGCVTVIPKIFKVTSEIVVGSGNQDEKTVNNSGPKPIIHCKSAELPRKNLKFYHLNRQEYSSTLPPSEGTDKIILGGGACQRRSCYYPAGAMPLPASKIHRSFGILEYCCCNNDLLLGGYQSEPSLTSSPSDGVGASSEEQPHIHSSATSFFNSFCCRAPPPHMIPPAPPITLKSVWNTVDRNIIIGFYGYSTGCGGEFGNTDTVEPKVQDIIDELEAQFDPTLENILGIRLIAPGRIFISLKSASIVKAFLQQFKSDLVLRNKQNPNIRVRIHFIEGATTKLTTTLALSGIPQELSDIAVISALNQFGQVVAPLEKRNYKGIDISERIAKMHLVITDSSVPEVINISGYEVRIRAEPQTETEAEASNNKLLTHGQQAASGDSQTSAVPPLPPQHPPKQPQRKYGFIHPNPPTIATTATTTAVVSGPSQSALKPHKPVIRSSSSAPRLETPVPGTLTCPLPPVEHKRHSSVCTGNIPPDQHPSKLVGKSNVPPQTQQQPKVTIAQPQTQVQTSSTPNLQPPPKKPLARLLVSSPGSFTPSPVSSPGSPVDNMIVHKTGGGGGTQQNQSQKEGPLLKAFYKSFERRTSDSRGHAPLTPSSSCSPRTRRKSSVQFAGVGKGKREPLPWCGCWGLGCG